MACDNSPEFYGFKKITDDDAVLMADLGVLYVDSSPWDVNLNWINQVKNLRDVLGYIIELKGNARAEYQFYIAVEDE